MDDDQTDGPAVPKRPACDVCDDWGCDHCLPGVPQGYPADT